MSERDESTPVNPISVKATECPVVKVTVYKDRAEVCREFETTVKSGVNELRIQEFVPIDEDSIRVDGKGNATIAEVSYQSKYVTDDEATMTAKEKELQEQLKALEEEKRELDLDTQKASLKKQWHVLDQFASTAAKNGQGESQEEKKNFQLDAAYFKGMREFMQQYKDIGKQLEAERLDLEKKCEAIDKKIQTVQRNLDEVRGNRHRGSEKRECVVVLEAEKETKVSLTVSYVVLGASWSPSYDLRMFTEQGNLKIIYYGLIRQSSGEDWADTKVFLSTAEPSIGGTIPTLPQTQLSVRKFRPPSHHLKAASLRNRSLTDNIRFNLLEDLDAGGGAGQERYRSLTSSRALPVRTAEVKVSESTTSTTYEIARQSSIPSDNTEHKVTVAIIDLKPALTYVTVPKIVPHAFLQAKVTNTSQYTLLAGRTNIFLDNSLVAKAEINAVSPKEEFECSLGVDPGVRVDYKPLVKMNASTGIISKSQVITYEQAIEIKNLHDYKIKVMVRDNVPRSLDEKIKVNLMSPFIDMKHPEKTEGVRLTKNNHVEWDLDLKELEKTEVTLKYTVEHPASEDVETTTAIGN